MNYTIAIPSYNRAELLNNQTLQTLANCGIDRQIINVFVVAEEEQIYIDKLNPNLYNKVIVGEKGLINQRRFIESYYPEGTKIVSLDDDIKSVDLSLCEYTSLPEFLCEAFKQLEEHKAYIWGVYPVYNPFFRQSKEHLTTDLRFIIGAFYGFINRNISETELTIPNDQKEDVERTIRYWLNDGVVLRFNRVGFQTKYYNNGGLGKLSGRMEGAKASSIEIASKYPDLCKIKIRKNGLYEIVLKQNAPKPILKNVKVLPPVEPERVSELYFLLESITVPLNSNKQGRCRSFGNHRAMTLGYVKARITRTVGLSYYTKKYPHIYEAIKTFGESICPFQFKTIHINHNVVCPRHIDPTNVGESMLVSFGDYEGCDLTIENEGTFNTNCQPIIFNGSTQYHYNTPLLSGNKYSLVFYSSV